jgi:hypothetical protein
MPVPENDYVFAADPANRVLGCSKDERGESVHLRVHEDLCGTLRYVCLSALHWCCEQAGERKLQDRMGLPGARPGLAA